MLSLLVAAALSLNGSWNFSFVEGKSCRDAADTAFVATDTIPVPGCFDAMPKWFMKRGTGLYRRTFTLDRAVDRAWLVIDGLGLYGRFWIDGREIGVDDLPWSRVELPAGPLAAGEHVVVAAVDNRFDWSYQKLVRTYYDFHCWGGFFHGVSLAFDNRRLFVRTRDWKTGTVEIEAVNFASRDFAARLVFDGKAEREVQFRNGRATVQVPGFRLWSPAAPNLHTVACDGVRERFGVRTIEARNRGIYLNGERIFLKGVNRHDQLLPLGASTPEAMMIIDIQRLKALGANFLRGAHYPQARHFLDLCDENGILVWEESLGWGNGQTYTRQKGVNELTDAQFVAKQVEQTRLMVRNSFNHPSVVIFAFMNELASDTAPAKALVDRLADTIHAEDSGRLVTFACNNIAKDICNEKTDIIAFNTYPGTIYGYPGEHKELAERIHNQVGGGIDWAVSHFRKRYPEKTIMISEIGVGAYYGEHDVSAPFRSEEFQDEHNALVAETAYANPDVAGLSYWQMYDTRTCWRDCEQNGKKPHAMSTAGLYTWFRAPKMCVRTVTDWFVNKTPANLLRKDH